MPRKKDTSLFQQFARGMQDALPGPQPSPLEKEFIRKGRVEGYTDEETGQPYFMIDGKPMLAVEAMKRGFNARL